jgi:hypothetical protein
MLLVPSIGFPIRARFFSSFETSEYGSNVSNDRLVLGIMTLGVPTSASFSLRLLSSRFLPSSVSPIFSMPWKGVISRPRPLILILPRSLILVLSRPPILPGLALIICYKIEKFFILDKLFNQDLEISTILVKVASGIVKRSKLMFILLSHVRIVEGTRLLVLQVSLDLH